MLVVRDLTKMYHKDGRTIYALDGVSVSAEAGEFVVVRGPSGSGKTTLLLAVGGLLAPDSGRVTLAGQDPYVLSPDARAGFRADNVGFVFQRFHLVQYLTVADNVRVAALAGAGESAARADELVERFGLAERAGHLPGELSVGERQRTALARAMLNRPKLICADEPTGNLDEANGQLVLEGLAEFVSAGGAVLLVTHDARVSQYAHKIHQLESGRLREG